MSDPFTKDPDVAKDFGFNWTEWLDGLTISSSAWTVPSRIASTAPSNTTTTTTIRLSGGTDGEDYELINTITASNGQTDERSMVIQVREASWRLTETELLTLGEIIVETPTKVASLVSGTTVNQAAYLRTEFELWAPIRNSHVRLKDDVDFDNQRKRDAITRRVRRVLGLSVGRIAGVFAGGISKAARDIAEADPDRWSPSFTTNLHQSR